LGAGFTVADFARRHPPKQLPNLSMRVRWNCRASADLFGIYFWALWGGIERERRNSSLMVMARIASALSVPLAKLPTD
jgi:hypothetical protein